VIGLAATGLATGIVSIWSGGSSAAFGKTVLTVTVFSVAASQTAALDARRRETDPASVGALFAVSCASALTLAGMATVAAWAEIGSSMYFRVFGALAVLDLLVVLLQPVIALARPRGEVYHLRLDVEHGAELERDIEATDFAAAASRAIREIEREGRRVRRVARV
jgi:hypothetical protein